MSKAEIKKLVDEWVATWNNYDLSMIPRLFLNDHRVTYFSSEKEGLNKGIDDLIKHHQEFGFVPGGKGSGNRLWLEDLEIEGFGDSVIVKANWLFQRENSETAQKGPVTMVYVATSEGYRIAHSHFSNY